MDDEVGAHKWFPLHLDTESSSSLAGDLGSHGSQDRSQPRPRAKVLADW